MKKMPGKLYFQASWSFAIIREFITQQAAVKVQPRNRRHWGKQIEETQQETHGGKADGQMDGERTHNTAADFE